MNLELRNYIRPSVHALRSTHQVRRMRNDLEALFEGTCVDAVVVLQGRGALFQVSWPRSGTSWLGGRTRTSPWDVVFWWDGVGDDRGAGGYRQVVCLAVDEVMTRHRMWPNDMGILGEVEGPPPLMCRLSPWVGAMRQVALRMANLQWMPLEDLYTRIRDQLERSRPEWPVLEEPRPCCCTMENLVTQGHEACLTHWVRLLDAGSAAQAGGTLMARLVVADALVAHGRTTWLERWLDHGAHVLSVAETRVDIQRWAQMDLMVDEADVEDLIAAEKWAWKGHAEGTWYLNGGEWTSTIAHWVYCAAWHGHLDTVQWLHALNQCAEHAPLSTPVRTSSTWRTTTSYADPTRAEFHSAMVMAACNDHVEVVRWMHEVVEATLSWPMALILAATLAPTWATLTYLSTHAYPYAHHLQWYERRSDETKRHEEDDEQGPAYPCDVCCRRGHLAEYPPRRSFRESQQLVIASLSQPVYRVPELWRLMKDWQKGWRFETWNPFDTLVNAAGLQRRYYGHPFLYWKMTAVVWQQLVGPPRLLSAEAAADAGAMQRHREDVAAYEAYLKTARFLRNKVFPDLPTEKMRWSSGQCLILFDGCRGKISLPTDYASGLMHVSPEDHARIGARGPQAKLLPGVPMCSACARRCHQCEQLPLDVLPDRTPEVIWRLLQAFTCDDFVTYNYACKKQAKKKRKSWVNPGNWTELVNKKKK